MHTARLINAIPSPVNSSNWAYKSASLLNEFRMLYPGAGIVSRSRYRSHPAHRDPHQESKLPSEGSNPDEQDSIDPTMMRSILTILFHL